MRKEPQPFPRDEYLARLSAVKLDIGKREIDVLFVTDPSNITYLSDYTSKSAYVPQGLIISLTEGEPTSLTRRMDAPAAIHQTFIDTRRIIGYPGALVANPDRDGCDAVIDSCMTRALPAGSSALK